MECLHRRSNGRMYGLCVCLCPLLRRRIHSSGWIRTCLPNRWSTFTAGTVRRNPGYGSRDAEFKVPDPFHM
ncbi:hypothetical protein EJB05_26689 [Eragrostis curvula]|uniref:Uncharacterized protein n=1 Tax=Eragrostis curvula TaxID=38414 RepID=A0A5J9ULR9_9POAL|nr:hypothetical protein EJB05_26689 [Eragrostis curvula]